MPLDVLKIAAAPAPSAYPAMSSCPDSVVTVAVPTEMRRTSWLPASFYPQSKGDMDGKYAGFAYREKNSIDHSQLRQPLQQHRD